MRSQAQEFSATTIGPAYLARTKRPKEHCRERLCRLHPTALGRSGGIRGGTFTDGNLLKPAGLPGMSALQKHCPRCAGVTKPGQR